MQNEKANTRPWNTRRSESIDILRDQFLTLQDIYAQTQRTYVRYEDLGWFMLYTIAYRYKVELSISVAKRSTMGTKTHSANVKSTLLTELSRVEREKLRIVFIGVTNYSEKVDPNFLRRFQQRIWVPLPTSEQKEGILALYLRQYNRSMEPSVIKYLCGFPSLLGCSGDHNRVLVDRAATEPLKELCENNHASWRKV